MEGNQTRHLVLEFVEVDGGDGSHEGSEDGEGPEDAEGLLGLAKEETRLDDEHHSIEADQC